MPDSFASKSFPGRSLDENESQYSLCSRGEVPAFCGVVPVAHERANFWAASGTARSGRTAAGTPAPEALAASDARRRPAVRRRKVHESTDRPASCLRYAIVAFVVDRSETRNWLRTGSHRGALK